MSSSPASRRAHRLDRRPRCLLVGRRPSVMSRLRASARASAAVDPTAFAAATAASPWRRASSTSPSSHADVHSGLGVGDAGEVAERRDRRRAPLAASARLGPARADPRATASRELAAPASLGRPERERATVERGRVGVRPERLGAVAGARGTPRAPRSRAPRCPRRQPGERERLEVVVRDEIGRDALVAADPARGEAVLLRPRGPRELRVGDVAHERVPEGKLLLARDRRRRAPAEELLPDEALQELVTSRPCRAPRRRRARTACRAPPRSGAAASRADRAGRAARR